MSVREKQFFEELLSVRPVTRSLVNDILQDEWPSRAAIVDFGIASQKHYEALYWPIRQTEIMPKELDAALGHGQQLTAMARAALSNPHKDVMFLTSWDIIYGRFEASPAIKAILDGAEFEHESQEPDKERGMDR